MRVEENVRNGMKDRKYRFVQAGLLQRGQRYGGRREETRVNKSLLF